MKKLAVSILALGLMLTGCGSNDKTSQSGSKELSEAKIGVIQYAEHPALDAAYKGFKDALIKAGVKEANIDYQNASNDPSNCTTIAEKLVNDGNDLIYAVATPAAQAVAGKTTSIPIVLSAVTDPASAGLAKTNEAPGGNVTGASDLTPIAEQMKLLKQLLPNAKKIAIMYCGAESNSEFQGKIAEAEAKKNGLEYITKTVADSNDIQAVTNAVVGEKVDAVYIPTDNLLAQYMSSVSQITNAAKIPCIVGEEGMTKNGGFATYGLSYENLGKLAAEQAISILKGEKTAGETPIGYLKAEDCKLIISRKVAKECGITIDEANFKGATFIE